MAKRTSSDGKELEKLVSRIYESIKDNPLAEVLHDVKLVNKHGDKSQFDVIVKIKVASSELLIAIECKDFTGTVEVSDIHVFGGKCDALKGIGRRIFVTGKGYQSGAIGAAKQHDIELYTLNEISQESIKSWVKWERSYATYPDRAKIGGICFHTQGGRVFSYIGDDLNNLNLNLILQSPGNELLCLDNSIEFAHQQPGFISGLVNFASEDLKKLTLSGDEKSVILPLPIRIVLVAPYITALEGCQVQVNQVEIIFDFVFIVARFEAVTVKSYDTQTREAEAQLVSTQVGPMRLEIIRNTINGETVQFAAYKDGQFHKLAKEQIKEFRD